MMTTDWTQEYFDDTYRRLFLDTVEPARTRYQVQQLLRLCAVLPGAAVLDVGCGVGRHSIELARLGFRVTGVDMNADVVCIHVHARYPEPKSRKLDAMSPNTTSNIKNGGSREYCAQPQELLHLVPCSGRFYRVQKEAPVCIVKILLCPVCGHHVPQILGHQGQNATRKQLLDLSSLSSSLTVAPIPIACWHENVAMHHVRHVHAIREHGHRRGTV